MKVTKVDHQIAVYGLHRMVLADWDGGPAHVLAERHGEGWNDPWTVSLPGVPGSDVECATRNEAIAEMIEKALNHLPDEGYATFEPHVAIGDQTFALRELP